MQPVINLKRKRHKIELNLEFDFRYMKILKITLKINSHIHRNLSRHSTY